MRRMQRTNFHITDRQSDLLRRAAERTGLSVAEIVRRAIDAWLDESRAKTPSGVRPDIRS